jgi:hypothetical protein
MSKSVMIGTRKSLPPPRLMRELICLHRTGTFNPRTTGAPRPIVNPLRDTSKPPTRRHTPSIAPRLSRLLPRQDTSGNLVHAATGLAADQPPCSDRFFYIMTAIHPRIGQLSSFLRPHLLPSGKPLCRSLQIALPTTLVLNDCK